MKTLRSERTNYVAAFLLGALIALLLNWPARANVVRAVTSLTQSAR